MTTTPPSTSPSPSPSPSPLDILASRLLGWAGSEPEPMRWPKLRAAWIAISLHVCVRLTLAVWFSGQHRWLLPLPGLCFIAGQFRRAMRPAAIVLAVTQCIRFGLTYPDVSNHYLVECLAVVIFAVVDLARDEERDLCLRMLSWLAIVVLLMSGLQKCLHGAYFHGQYLAYMVANTDRYRDFFAPILSQADLVHLKSLEGAMQGLKFSGDQLLGALPGPYRVHSTLFVLVSNLVWLSEITLALGLLWRRVRPVALVLVMVVMAGILASSRELFFDTLFINLLLLFARTDLNRKLLPLSLAAYGYYLLGGLDVVHVSFVW